MNYTVEQWMLIFYLYCVMGWLLESAWVSYHQKILVNRGFLRGPMIPIYGCGAVMLLLIGYGFFGHPVLLFLTGMTVATVFEYIVGAGMEKLFRVKYWDYSYRRFQYKGRICLFSSVIWGVLTLILNYGIQSQMDQMIRHFPKPISMVLVWIWTIAFGADVIWSVRSALSLARILQKMEKLQEQAEILRYKLVENAMEKRQAIQDEWLELKKQTEVEAEERLEALRMVATAHKAKLEESRLQMHLALREAEDRMEETVQNLKWVHKSLLKGNPGAISASCDRGLKAIRCRLKK